jgi:predicted enzyme related to lactoylglutathione lyase
VRHVSVASALQPDQGGRRVPQPVVHFEVIGKDPERLRQCFGELFGWAFDTPSPVAQEIAEPESYGFLDLVTAEDGTGIRGGIGGGPSYDSHAVFYVGVPKVEAATASRTTRRHTRHGSGDVTEWPRRRAFHGPRGQPDRCRRRRMRAAPVQVTRSSSRSEAVTPPGGIGGAGRRGVRPRRSLASGGSARVLGTRERPVRP